MLHSAPRCLHLWCICAMAVALQSTLALNSSQPAHTINNSGSQHFNLRRVLPSSGGEATPSLSLDAKFGPDKMRPLFQMAPGYVNMNHGSYGSVPKEVIEARRRLLDQVEARPDQWFRHDMQLLLYQVRQRVAAYVNAEVEDVVIVDNGSTAVNTVLRSLPFNAGDHVLIFSTAYGVVKNTLQWLSETRGIKVVELPIKFPVTGPEDFLAPWRDALNKNGSTYKLAIFSPITADPAVVLPSKQLVDLCREKNVSVLLDAAHALGQVPVDLKELDPDYWLGNGHKWLFSPKSATVLYVRKDKQQRLWPYPTVISTSISTIGWKDFVGRFVDTGTRDYTPFIALGDALTFRERLGDADIMRYNQELALWAGHYLSELWGTRILQPDSMTGAMTNVELPVLTLDKAMLVSKELSDVHDIYVNTQTANSTGPPIYYLRLSSQIYLGKEDFVKMGNLVLKSAREHSQ